jgi:CHAT domain-containing protein/Tfp pilus assembly protein PilF
MRIHKFVLIIFSALLFSAWQPWWLSFSPVFGKSVVVAQTRDERKAEAVKLYNQGLQEVVNRQFEPALKTWLQALTIFREVKDRKGEAGTLVNIAITYGQALEDYSKAIVYAEQALHIASDINGGLEIKVKSLSVLGVAHRSLQNYEKAIEYLQKHLFVARKIKNIQEESEALGNLGLAYDNIGRYTEAIDYHLQSLDIAIRTNNRASEGRTLGNLGDVYKNLGNYSKAIDYYKKSLEIAQETKNSVSESTALISLGAVYQKLDNYDTAINYLSKGLVIAQNINSRGTEAFALNTLGLVHQDLGDYPKAIYYHEKTLELAREINNRSREVNSLNNLGLTYLYLGNLPEAIDFFKRQLNITEKLKSPENKAIALNNMGLFLYKYRRFQEAESYLIKAIKIRNYLRTSLLDDANKISIFDTQTSSYRILQPVLIAQNKFEAALGIAEQGRARAFVESLAKTLSPGKNKTIITPPTIEQIKQIAKTQNSTIIQYSIISDLFKNNGKVQPQQSELYIWVVKPTGKVNFRKIDIKPFFKDENTNLASLEDLIENIRDSIGVSDRNIFTQTNSTTQNTTTKRNQFAIKVFPSPEDDPSKDLQKLHQILIEPIADLLPSNPDERVIFVPQDELFLVPFPALLDQKGKYLIEKHTILTAPSIQVLELTRQQKQKNQLSPASDTLIVGNPTMPSVSPKIGDEPQKLADLPGAKLEADAIAKLLGTKALTGDAANKAAVLSKMPQAKIIHLATHGILNNFQALKSAIALAPSEGRLALAPTPNNNDNALLTAEEILDLKLKADLVVLSACDTGRGRITGDGVIGLSRSLFIAGTPSVIVSLWAVPDAPTAELMTEFYKNLYKNKNRLDKAQALRMAMLKMKDKYSDSPRKWAAFTLIGESE